MEKNLRLIFALIGSLGLILLKTPFFYYTALEILDGSNLIVLFDATINLLCFTGIILSITISIMLIVTNLFYKK